MTRTRRNRRERDHRQLGATHFCDLSARRLCPRLAFQPGAAKKRVCRRILSRRPQPWAMGVRADLRGDQLVRRQFHGIPVAGLHARLGAGAVDSQLHAGAARRHGAARQACEPARPPVRRGDDSRPHQGAFPLRFGRDDSHAAGALFHVFLSTRPVQGRQQNHDHPAAGRGHLSIGRQRRRRRDRRTAVDWQRGAGLRAVPAGVRVFGDRVHGVWRLPRGGVDRRDAGHRYGRRGDHPAVPHACPSGRTDQGHRAIERDDAARDRHRHRHAWPSAHRNDHTAQGRLAAPV